MFYGNLLADLQENLQSMAAKQIYSKALQHNNKVIHELRKIIWQTHDIAELKVKSDLGFEHTTFIIDPSQQHYSTLAVIQH